MAVLFSDDFNRANGAPGANWNAGFNGATASAIATNKLRMGTTSTGPSRCLTTTSAHPDTVDVKVTVTQASATGDGGPCARDTGGSVVAPTMYVLDSYPNILELYRHNSSPSGTLLATGIANTTGANGVLGLEVSGVGGTVTVKSYLGGVLKQTVSDTNASRIVTAGRTGIFNWAAVGAASDYDDFQVEDLAAAGATSFPFRPPSMQPFLVR